VDEAAVRRTLLERHGIEIGAGLGPLAGKIWRVGLMGESATTNHVLLFLAALGGALSEHGYAPASDGPDVDLARTGRDA
jgi:alanine-glyoxylate transaminase/serine-glyoxylate transaminase/serine-pyruvate transaminase